VPAVGWQVFWGSGDELGQALPLLPFFDGLGCASPGGKPDSNRLRLADGAAGNPLYVTELLAALDRRSSLTITDAGTAELASGSAPSSLSAAIADRLGFVAGPTREVLKAAALLGMEFAVPDLAVVLSRSVADLITAVDEACAAGVLAEFGGGLGFRHPLIRAALYDETPAPLRAAWHRDVGRALAEAGALTNTAIIPDAGPHATQHVKCRCSIKPKLRPIRQVIPGLTWCFAGSAGLRSGYLLQGERDRGAEELEGLPLGAGRFGEHRDGDIGAGVPDLVAGQGGQVF